MLSPLFLGTSAVAAALSLLVTWKVVAGGRLMKKLPFAAVMLALATFSLLEFMRTLMLVSPADLPLVEPFLFSLTLVLLLMCYGGELVHVVH